jgi:hypothetical protein
MKSNTIQNLILAAIATLPVEEAKATLATLNIPSTGAKKPNTILAEAIENGKARLALTLDIKPAYPDPDQPDTMMPSAHTSRVYSYKDRKTSYSVK